MTDTNHSNPDDPTRAFQPIPPPPDPRPSPLEPRREGPPLPHSAHLQGWAQVLLALAAVIGSFTGVIGLFLQDRNGTKIEAVQTQQNQQVETAESVKAALEKKAAADRIALESNLRASWKYLESVADDSGLPRDREAANNAKRALDEFIARKKNGG